MIGIMCSLIQNWGLCERFQGRLDITSDGRSGGEQERQMWFPGPSFPTRIPLRHPCLVRTRSKNLNSGHVWEAPATRAPLTWPCGALFTCSSCSKLVQLTSLIGCKFMNAAPFGISDPSGFLPPICQSRLQMGLHFRLPRSSPPSVSDQLQEARINLTAWEVFWVQMNLNEVPISKNSCYLVSIPAAEYGALI